MSTQLKENEAAAAYGSLYMQRGEGLEKAKQQINHLSEQKPLLWFFDIVCTPNQMERAKNNASFITGWIQGRNPGLDQERIVVGVTTKDSDRPAWQTMQNFIKQANGVDVAEVLTPKDGRRYVYIGGKIQR